MTFSEEAAKQGCSQPAQELSIAHDYLRSLTHTHTACMLGRVILTATCTEKGYFFPPSLPPLREIRHVTAVRTMAFVLEPLALMEKATASEVSVFDLLRRVSGSTSASMKLRKSEGSAKWAGEDFREDFRR
ncbi:hypothetical protein cyc_05849 [Cyclospora cayetanensis]|uniref:Uncharacterized protein n=1 Tax=Cyclospora cayetanensis TaxID=88456 RepID=A0A1D3D0J4_9EIME|nr:hypothetical protein cyc_05849 [Cyclospora cayetanensis]